MAPPSSSCRSSSSSSSSSSSPSSGSTGEKALLEATLDGNLHRIRGIVKSLTKEKGDPSASFPFTIHGVSLLHAAACQGHLKICKYFVEELGIDVNIPGCRAGALGVTPFMLAAQLGELTIVKYFFNHGGDLLKGDSNGQTVLHHAAASGSYKVTEFLLSKGVPVNIDCGHGTPLLTAAINEEDKILKILLNHHADPNIIISGVGAPLPSALIHCSLKCMKLLLKANAHVNYKGSILTLLVFAAMQGGYTNFIKLLLKAGADPNIPDDLGRLPIEVAAIRDCKEEVEMLFPLTAPIPNLPDWSIEGVISHVKIKDKQPMHSVIQRNIILHTKSEENKFAQGLEISACSDLVPTMAPSLATIHHLEYDNNEREKMDEFQLYVKIGGMKIPVFIPSEATVREAIYDAAKKVGMCFNDYYIVHDLKCLKLDVSIISQDLIPGTVLSPRFRLRGGVIPRITRTETFVLYTNQFGDELFDLCHIPGHGIGVSLSDIGANITSHLFDMVDRLFQNGQSAPVFTSADIIFDYNCGCFRFAESFVRYWPLTTHRLSTALRCLGLVIRRTFHYDPVRLSEGQANFRVLATGADADQVDGVIPQYLGYLVGDLAHALTIVHGASRDEIMSFFRSHIGKKTVAGRIGFQLCASLQFFYYPGGFTAADLFMNASQHSWVRAMVPPLTRVRGFRSLHPACAFSLPSFCSHIRNFISHPDVHQLTEKQAEAIIMMYAAQFVHQVTIELMLRIPLNARLGGAVPYPPPTFSPEPGRHITIVNGCTWSEVCHM